MRDGPQSRTEGPTDLTAPSTACGTLVASTMLLPATICGGWLLTTVRRRLSETHATAGRRTWDGGASISSPMCRNWPNGCPSTTHGPSSTRSPAAPAILRPATISVGRLPMGARRRCLPVRAAPGLRNHLPEAAPLLPAAGSATRDCWVQIPYSIPTPWPVRHTEVLPVTAWVHSPRPEPIRAGSDHLRWTPVHAGSPVLSGRVIGSGLLSWSDDRRLPACVDTVLVVVRCTGGCSLNHFSGWR